MAVSSSNISFILIVALNVVQGTLTPNGNVSVDCGSTQTFDCAIPGEPIEWTTSGLRGISRGPFMARIEAIHNSRMTSPDKGDTAQFSVSSITVSGFSISDNGGTIQCINAENNTIRGMARISVGLLAPAKVVAKAKSCNTVSLQWTQPSGPNDITTSVSCTPPSPGCAGCTTSPCTITGLNPNTEYEFTVTLNSVMCGTSTNTTGIGTRDLRAPTNVVATVESCDNVTLQWTQPSEPNDITTSVSCTPPSPGCAECKASPCNITSLNPSTEYEFTVTLNSGGCRTSMNTTTARTKDSCVRPSTNTPVDTSPSISPLDSSAPLAALVLLLLLIPLLYPLGVLVAYLVFFKDKSYCEVFWCCFCCRKDTIYWMNSIEQLIPCTDRLREHREENVYQDLPKKKVVSTGNVMQQQGNPDGIQYADLDFSKQGTGRNVIHTRVDPVTYAEM